jgi:hypothetical protein
MISRPGLHAQTCRLPKIYAGLWRPRDEDARIRRSQKIQGRNAAGERHSLPSAAIDVLKRQVLVFMPKKPVTSVGGSRKPAKI